MCAIPAQVAGRRADRARLAARARTGALNPLVLAAAALCGVEEIYAMGGAQAIFALAYGTETIAPVDVDRRPRQRLGAGGEAGRLRHGRDRLARRPLGADAGRRPRHRPRVGGARPLRPGRARRRKPAGRRSRSRSTCSTRSPRRPRRAAADAAQRRRRAAGAGPGARPRAPRSTSPTPSRPSTWSCCEEDAALLAERVTTAGCVFVGRYGATAFGDYVAGSNHVLPTGGAGRFSGPLGPGDLPPPDRRRSRFRPRPRRSWRRTSTPSPAPRASPSTASQR